MPVHAVVNGPSPMGLPVADTLPRLAKNVPASCHSDSHVEQLHRRDGPRRRS